MFKNNYINKIKVEDQSQISNVDLLPYRVLRGLPALYEKYGYVSTELNTFRESVLPSLTWSSIESLIKKPEHLELFETYNRDKFSDWKTETIVNLFKNIPFEEETKHDISSTVFNSLIESKVSTFKLDPDSTVWKKWDDDLQFVEFLEVYHDEKQPSSLQKTKKYPKKMKSSARSHGKN